jgi:hypothetical protein
MSTASTLGALHTPFSIKLLQLYTFLRLASDTAEEAAMEGAGPILSATNSDEEWEPLRNIVINTAKVASGESVATALLAAGRAAGWEKINSVAYGFVESVSVDPNAHAVWARTETAAIAAGLESISILASQTDWRELLGVDVQLRAAMVVNSFENGNYNPVNVVEGLSKIDLTCALPVVECFFLWSIYELLQEIPTNDDLTASLNTIVQSSNCDNCGAIFARVETIAGLSAVTGPVFGDTGVDIKPLIAYYAARPPTHAEVIRRLIAL